MKKLIQAIASLSLLGGLFLFCLLTGCSDDDDEETTIEMVGFWTVTDVEIDAISAGGQSLVNFFVNVGGMTQEQAQANSTMVESMIKLSITGTIDIRADKTYTSVLGGETETGTWSQSADGKVFTIYDNTDDEFVATINTLTATMANIAFVYDTYQDLDMDAATPDILLNITGTITLSR